MVRRGNVRTAEAARAVVQEVAGDSAIVFFTLVSEEVREALREAAERQFVPTLDLLGPVLASLAGVLKSPPRCDPRLLEELEQRHIDRVDAVDFTLAHDDGLRAHELPQADVVLVGVSRVSKSATCFALACRGVRAANVPLVPGVEPPRELLEIDPDHVIGLTASVFRLQSIRQSRVSGMRMGEVEGYVDVHEIAKELRFASDMMKRHGWRCIDVSFKAVEEVAKEVLRLTGRV